MPRPPRHQPAPAPAPRPVEDHLVALEQRATKVRTRRHQQLAATGAPEVVYVVTAGLLVLQTLVPGQRRRLLTLLYPQDIFLPAVAPSLPGAVLSSACACEVLRMPAPAFETLLADHPSLTRHICRRLADQHARAVLHTAIVGGLTGEERVASLLIELALHLGTQRAAGVAFETPLSRTEMADYLALNADTLSRIMSRLKASRLVRRTGLQAALVTDLDGLCALSPLAGALLAAHAGGSVRANRPERV